MRSVGNRTCYGKCSKQSSAVTQRLRLPAWHQSARPLPHGRGTDTPSHPTKHGGNRGRFVLLWQKLSRSLGFATLLWMVWLGVPAQASADFLDIWLEAPAKGRLVVLRQTPDLSKGFDTFQVVELDTKKRVVVKSVTLAESERKASLATGQFEVYLASRDRERRKLEKEYFKSGYSAPLGVWSNTPPGVRTLVLESGETRLVLALAYEKGGPVLRLSMPGQKEVLLPATEVLTASEGAVPATLALSFRHVLVARRGRVLVAVVREMPAPSPEFFPRDRLLIVPLTESLKELGITEPLKNISISIP